METNPFRITAQDLLSLDLYLQKRPEIQKRILKIKALRRIEVGPHMSFYFENKDTLVYQIQEMIRVERLIDPAAIQQEIDTYQELMPAADTLSATLMFECPEAEERKSRLRALKDVVQKVALVVDDKHIQAVYDPRQISEERASAVQFLKFTVGKPTSVPKSVKLTLNHPEYSYSCTLSPEQVQSIWSDLQ